MVKPIGYFLGGFLVAAGVVYLACHAGIYLVYGEPAHGAAMKGISEAAYARWFDDWVQPQVLRVTALAALVCAAFCGYRGLNPSTRPSRSKPLAWKKVDVPLARDEVHRVAQAAMSAGAAQRNAEYLQGFLVGRFAEDDPGLASRISGFNAQHMSALQQDLLDFQDRIVERPG